MLISTAALGESLDLSDSRRLWSLWEMINFRFSSAHHVLGELLILIRVSNHNMEFVAAVGAHSDRLANDPKHPEALSDCQKSASAVCALAKQVFANLNCPHINAATSRLERWATDAQGQWSELNTRSRALRNAIEIELKQYYYYQYPKEQAEGLLKWKDEWNLVTSHFKSTEPDIFSAVDCYALGHYTASVFHSMRVLEHGLASLAEHVDLTFDTQQWHTIIEQIEAKIRDLRRTLPHGVAKNERMQILSEAAKEFFYFKDGWRNYVSHNRGNYDALQARSVLEHVRTFMTALSKALKE